MPRSWTFPRPHLNGISISSSHHLRRSRRPAAARTQVINPALNQLGQIATALTQSANAQQSSGLDLNGQFGREPVFRGRAAGDGLLEQHRCHHGHASASRTPGALTPDNYLLAYNGGRLLADRHHHRRQRDSDRRRARRRVRSARTACPSCCRELRRPETNFSFNRRRRPPDHSVWRSPIRRRSPPPAPSRLPPPTPIPATPPSPAAPCSMPRTRICSLPRPSSSPARPRIRSTVPAALPIPAAAISR